jgi:transcriptional regulator with XRE-family HTH domain
MTETRQRLAERLRNARLEAGLTIRQLELQTGISRSAISRLERTGRVSIHNLSILSRALELSESELYAELGQDAPPLAISLPAMLRAEYDLPPEAIKQIQHNIEQIAREYQQHDYE